ncbi:MAG TPA: acetate--CoA ligase family protein [Bellilinea sp.]|nr:acetate--CoA ligase family protein [Bellilinea sp.]
MHLGLEPFFAPRGVAIIGASASPTKLSFGILRNLSQYGYTGQIAPVNPKEDEILGFKSYPDIAAVPDPVDLAVIVLPAALIPGVVEDCGKRGLKGVIVISGGFKEIGPQGAAIEKSLVTIAQRYHMRLVGPNCVGTLDMYTGLNTTFIQGLPARGGIGFISQSGAVVGGVFETIREKFIGFSVVATLGNEADVTETDMIEFLAADERTKVITSYVEAITDGQRFIQVARKVSPHKPIVMLKAGRTSAGARAVSSHTGSLAGTYTAYKAAFEQAGVIEVETLSDLFDISFGFANLPLPTGARVAMITNGGGPAAMVSDALAMNGLQMADLSPETQEFLRPHLNPAAQIANPVDMLGAADAAEFTVGLKGILADPNVDIAIAILIPQALVNTDAVAQAICDQAQGQSKPVLAVIVSEVSTVKAREILHSHGIPMYVNPETPGRVLSAMLRYARWLKKPALSTEPLSRMNQGEVTKILEATKGRPALGEVLTRPLLAAYGMPVVAGGMAKSADEAVETAQRVGYPVVMKIVSPDILHKSDVGGIRLNLADDQAVRTNFTSLMQDIAAKKPEAVLEGVLIEAMAPKGQEVIVGMRRDPNFGPLMMFGLGGIYVELFGDVSFRVAPLTREDAADMVRNTRAGRLLTGFRGMPEADVEAVVETILRLSQLAQDFPQISEVEINPLLVLPKGKGALALDGRVILQD